VGRVTEIVLLLASPLHRYEGRPKDGAVPYDGVETPDEVSITAHKGIVGDRYFGHRAHIQSSVTILAAESLDGLGNVDPARTRRNVVTRGIDIDVMLHAEFSLDCGDGPVWFRANQPANPCAWMDEQVAPGAFKHLRKHGGMRCEPLTDGTLRIGPVTLALR
jgi:MOSC domain-containing protein YiiM